MVASIRPWSPDASLESIAESWRQRGLKAIAELEGPLQAAGDAKTTANALVYKAMMFQSEGDPKHAYETLEEARSLVAKNDSLAQEMLYTIIYFQGVAAMRRGENDNCIDCRGESSCILPISPAAVHTNPTGSRLAIGHFTEYLEQFPDDLEVQWLLNLAHMTLGEYPDKVDSRFLISLDRYCKSEFDIGRFRDVGHLVGVNRFNQAGGAIMEDFDNDGRLDIAVTSFDPTLPMSYYRNKGDGTFEDRSQEAGVTNQLGGLVCVQTDYNNDGRMDVFIPRGAWLSHAIRPSLLRNNGDGTFTDVTKEAGLLDPVNSNRRGLGRLRQRRLARPVRLLRAQPNRLYHNQRRRHLRGGGLPRRPVTPRCSASARERRGSTSITTAIPTCFSTTWSGAAALYRNDRNGRFTNVTSQMGIDGPYYGFSCWAWDYDNDGWLDIFATSYDRTIADVVKGLMGQPHTRQFQQALSERARKAVRERDQASGPGHGLRHHGEQLTATSTTTASSTCIWAPANRASPRSSPTGCSRTWPASGSPRSPGPPGTGHLQKGHGVACGDWDRDGDVDLFVQTGGAVNGDKFHNLLFQNPGQGNHWLTVKLVGKKTNRAAIGARIKVVTAGEQPLTVHRHVSSGSSFGANPLATDHRPGQGRSDCTTGNPLADQRDDPGLPRHRRRPGHRGDRVRGVLPAAGLDADSRSRNDGQRMNCRQSIID